MMPKWVAGSNRNQWPDDTETGGRMTPKYAAVIDHINAALAKPPQAGFWKCFKRIRNKKALY
jgi:hypothetical protein